MEKLQGTSMDIVQDNIEKLKQIFPEIFTEGKIDFQVLKQLLGEHIENDKERYSFTWKGKTQARQIAQDTSTGTLRPDRDNLKDWENTENLYIEGDNLEVLKLLQKSYHGKIKMIYIDPPYNTGKDFVYKDNFKDNIDNYKTITGQKTSEGYKSTTNTETDGSYHSNWLNMMYPRLKLARNLLTDDGVIFISIDDNEVTNLKKICDEIFGEGNFISDFIWINNERGRSIDKFIANTNENILSYAKNISYLEINQKIENNENLLEEYNLKDEKSYYKKGDPLYNNNSIFNIDTRPNLTYTIYVNKKTGEKKCIHEKYKLENGEWFLPKENLLGADWIKIIPPLRKTNNKIGCWRWGIEKFMKESDEELILEEKDGNYMFFSKNRLSEDNSKSFKFKNYITGITGVSGTNEVIKILENKIFNNPKPLNLLKLVCTIGMNSNSIILDFFSGSATTAHAVMQLNAEDGGNRKYIMVQLPEVCDEKSEAYKAGYKNICEIGKERIRRAGEKIKSDETLPAENREKLDIGFKVFKLDSSNIKEWDSETEDLRQSLFDSIDNIKSDRTSLDILYEILLKYGLDLNVPIVENKHFYSIGGGTLLINLDKEIDMEVIDSICEEYKTLLEIDEDFKTTVVLRDSSFANDVDKTNAMKKLEQVGIKEVRSI